MLSPKKFLPVLLLLLLSSATLSYGMEGERSSDNKDGTDQAKKGDFLKKNTNEEAWDAAKREQQNGATGTGLTADDDTPPGAVDPGASGVRDKKEYDFNSLILEDFEQAAANDDIPLDESLLFYCEEGVVVCLFIESTKEVSPENKKCIDALVSILKQSYPELNINSILADVLSRAGVHAKDFSEGNIAITRSLLGEIFKNLNVKSSSDTSADNQTTVSSLSGSVSYHSQHQAAGAYGALPLNLEFGATAYYYPAYNPYHNSIEVTPYVWQRYSYTALYFHDHRMPEYTRIKPLANRDAKLHSELGYYRNGTFYPHPHLVNQPRPVPRTFVTAQSSVTNQKEELKKTAVFVPENTIASSPSSKASSVIHPEEEKKKERSLQDVLLHKKRLNTVLTNLPHRQGHNNVSQEKEATEPIVLGEMKDSLERSDSLQAKLLLHHHHVEEVSPAASDDIKASSADVHEAEPSKEVTLLSPNPELEMLGLDHDANAEAQNSETKKSLKKKRSRKKSGKASPKGLNSSSHGSIENNVLSNKGKDAEPASTVLSRPEEYLAAMPPEGVNPAEYYARYHLSPGLEHPYFPLVYDVGKRVFTKDIPNILCSVGYILYKGFKDCHETIPLEIANMAGRAIYSFVQAVDKKIHEKWDAIHEANRTQLIAAEVIRRKAKCGFLKKTEEELNKSLEKSFAEVLRLKEQRLQEKYTFSNEF